MGKSYEIAVGQCPSLVQKDYFKKTYVFLLCFLFCFVLHLKVYPAINFVQSNSSYVINTTSSLAFSANNTAGNFIVVAVRHGILATVTSFSDSRGNTYSLAGSRMMTEDSAATDIYYAANIASGANTITVNLSISHTLRIACHEYSGIALVNPLDAFNSADGFGDGFGAGTAPNSGSITTQWSDELIFGVVFTAETPGFTAAGIGYTQRTALDKMITQDKFLPAGTYFSDATLGGWDEWGSIVVSFKAMGALPIELIDFNANCNYGKVNFNWVTATESNNDYFTLEGSVDAVNFTTAGTIEGAGTSSSLKKYDYACAGTINKYYRLKQTDFDGKHSYSKIITVDCDQTLLKTDFTLYPNPGNGENLSISLNANWTEEVSVVIHDIFGKQIFSNILITSDDGNNVFSLDLLHKLNAGIYLVTATSGNEVINKKLIVK